MTTRTPTRTPDRTTTPAQPDARLHSIQASARHFGAMRVLPSSALPDEDQGRSSALARRLDQAAMFAPRSHKGPPQRSYTPSEGNYQGTELEPYAGRPGAMDACALPSRMGNRLHYRDGRVETVG